MPRDMAGLQAFNASITNPQSPDYRHFLTQDEANARFNPTAEQEARVRVWLAAHGFAVHHTYANHLLIDAEGSVADAEQMLHVSINDYRAVTQGREFTFYSPDRDPTIDSSLSDVVADIVGLDNFPRAFRHFSGTNGYTRGTPPYYPQDIATAYDVTPLWSRGYTGAGQHLAITLWNVPPSDATLQRWAQDTGASISTVANGRLKVHPPVSGGSTDPYSDQEAGLDIEAAASMAPDATIDYYEIAVDGTGAPTQAGFADALNAAGTANNDWEISNSYGIECEAGLTTQDNLMQQMENIFTVNLATGHNYLFGSGDQGEWCAGTETARSRDEWYPASSPSVTTVGGTKFTGTIAGGYPGEAVWDSCESSGYYPGTSSTCTLDSQQLPYSAGAGVSTVFPQPSWQTIGPALGGRGYPDIAADADPTTGTYICYGLASTSSAATCSTYTAPPSWNFTVGQGTSLATPLWAGILTDINQYMVTMNEQVLGFIDPALYFLGHQYQGYTTNAPLHDITSGWNDCTCSVANGYPNLPQHARYAAGLGWDNATGWGSPDVWNLAQDLLYLQMPFEAEAIPPNTLSGGATVVSCSPCWGGQGVTSASGGSLTFQQMDVGSEGYYTVRVLYINSGSTNLTILPKVNSEQSPSLSLPPTQPYSEGSTSFITHLHRGWNTLQIAAFSGSWPVIDRVQISHASTPYEAESGNNTLSGTAAYASCANCSGSMMVTGLGPTGTLQFNGVGVSPSSLNGYQIVVSYSDPDAGNRAMYLKVNSQSPFLYYLPPTGGAGSVGRYTLPGPFTLNSGYNSISIYGPSGAAPDIDKIDILPAPKVYEAEVASLSGGAAVSTCSYCSGGAWVTGLGINPSTGQNGTLGFSITSPESNSEWTMTIVYENDDSTARQAQLSIVNGANLALAWTLTFPPTSGRLSTLTMRLPLYVGTANSLTLKGVSGGSPAPDVDTFTLSP